MADVNYGETKKQIDGGYSNPNPNVRATSSHISYAYDLEGNKHNVNLANGRTYLTDGSKLPTGWTVQTGGGIFKMGDNGVGYKVDSHNQRREPERPTFDRDRNDDRYNTRFEDDRYSKKMDELYDLIYGKSEYPEFNYNSKYDSDIKELLDQLKNHSNNLPDAKEIYDRILKYMPEVKLREIMGYDEGKKVATDQIEPEFLLALEKTLKGIDKNALRSGFFGQLPTLDSKQKVAGEMTLQKALAIAQLANQLVSQDKVDAYNEAGFDRQNQLDKLNTVLQGIQIEQGVNQSNNAYLFNLLSSLAGLDESDFNKQLSKYNADFNASNRELQTLFNLLEFNANRDDAQFSKNFQTQQYNDNRYDVDWDKFFKERAYNDGRTDVDWEKNFKAKQYEDSRIDTEWQKGITEANLLGTYKGQPTMAYTQMLHGMKIDNKQLEMAEKKMNHDISATWKQLSQNDAKISQAWSDLGLKQRQVKLSEDNFMLGIKEKALGLATDELIKTGRFELDFDGNVIQNSNYKYIIQNELFPLMDGYTKILLGDPGAFKNFPEYGSKGSKSNKNSGYKYYGLYE